MSNNQSLQMLHKHKEAEIQKSQINKQYLKVNPIQTYSLTNK